MAEIAGSWELWETIAGWTLIYERRMSAIVCFQARQGCQISRTRILQLTRNDESVGLRRWNSCPVREVLQSKLWT